MSVLWLVDADLPMGRLTLVTKCEAVAIIVAVLALALWSRLRRRDPEAGSNDPVMAMEEGQVEWQTPPQAWSTPADQGAPLSLPQAASPMPANLRGPPGLPPPQAVSPMPADVRGPPGLPPPQEVSPMPADVRAPPGLPPPQVSRMPAYVRAPPGLPPPQEDFPLPADLELPQEQSPMPEDLGAPPGLSMPADLGAPPGLSLPQVALVAPPPKLALPVDWLSWPEARQASLKTSLCKMVVAFVMALYGRAAPLHRVGCHRLACIHYEDILEKMLPKRDSEDLNLQVLLWGFQHDGSYACLRLLGLGAQLRFEQCGEHVSKQALPRAGALEAFSYCAAASKFMFVVRSGIIATGNPAKALVTFSRPASLRATARSEHVPDQAADVWLWKSDKTAGTIFTSPLQTFAELYEHNALAGGQGVSEASPTSSDSSGYWSDEAVSDPSTRSRAPSPPPRLPHCAAPLQLQALQRAAGEPHARRSRTLCSRPRLDEASSHEFANAAQTDTMHASWRGMTLELAKFPKQMHPIDEEYPAYAKGKNEDSMMPQLVGDWGTPVSGSYKAATVIGPDVEVGLSLRASGSSMTGTLRSRGCTDRDPDNLGFDLLKLSKDAESMKSMQLENGRLAMMAFTPPAVGRYLPGSLPGVSALPR
eukprot:s689_g20.t2